MRRIFLYMTIGIVAIVFPSSVGLAQTSSTSSTSGGEEDSEIYSALDVMSENSRLSSLTFLTDELINNSVMDSTTSSIETASTILQNRLNGTTDDSTTSESTRTATGLSSSTNTINTGDASQIDEDTSMYAPKLVISFALPTPVERATRLAKDISIRMRTTPNLSRQNHIEVRLSGNVATLTGTVATPRDRILVERVIMFEPGIFGVRNELTVDPKLAAQDPLWASVNGDYDQLPSVEALRASRQSRQKRLTVETVKSSERRKNNTTSTSLPHGDE